MIGIIVSLVILLVVLFFASGLKIVPQSSTMVIERLGKYNRTLNSGVNIIIPLFDKPKTILWDVPADDGGKYIRKSHWIDLREQICDYPKQSVITKDNVSIDIDALLYFQITEPEKAVYEISNLFLGIANLCSSSIRNIVGAMTLDELLTSRDTINGQLRDILDEATDKWGVKVNRVELKDIQPPQSIQEEMEKQMRAERDRRATILIAEGEKQAKILEAEGFKASEISKAEGEKTAAILKAEGEAEAIAKIRDAIGSSTDYTNYLIAMKYIDTLGKMVEGKDNKTVYVPYEASAVLSSLGGIKEMFSK